MHKEIELFMKEESEFYLQEFQKKIFYGPISFEKLKEAENNLGLNLPKNYKDFLLNYGCGLCGQVEVFGLGDLNEMKKHYYLPKSSFVEETLEFREYYGGEYTDFIVIGQDGCGNYILLNVNNELVISPDHNFGGVYTLANNFEEYLLKSIQGKLEI